jgi:hypothetical protein
MAKSKQRRIFLRDSDRLYNFMWANLTADGSVVLGLLNVTKGEVAEVYAPIQGRLRSTDLLRAEGETAAKFTFHASGIFKGNGYIGLDPNALDRPTTVGRPLSEIVEPQRMLEILLPKLLCCADRKPRKDDLVLNFTANPGAPLRCAITCMAVSRFQAITWANTQILENSFWEVHNTLAIDTHAWVWTVGQCHSDRYIPPDFLVALLGSIRWGRPPDERNLRP